MLQSPRSLLLIALALLGVGVGISLLWEAPVPPCGPAVPPPPAPFLIAARGAPDHVPGPTWVGFTMSGVFEDTLPAFDRAIARGMGALDFAVRLSADHVLMVVEDDDVTRTTNAEGLVSALKADELTALDAGGGAPIPWAEQVFEQYADRVTYHVRIPEGGEAGEEIGEALGELLAPMAAADKVWVAAPSPEALIAVRRGAPGLKTILILPDVLGIAGARVDGACLAAVELPAEGVSSRAVVDALAGGMQVFAAGVKSTKAWEDLKALGVSAALTSFTSLPGEGDEPPAELPPQGEVETWE